MTPINDIARHLLLGRPLLHRANTYRLMQQTRRQALRAARRARGQAIPILTARDVLGAPTRPETTCHIIGSGESLHESRTGIDEDDSFVIGNNFSCLSGLTFDLYFVEFGGPRCADIAATQVKALDHFAVQKSASVLFKNLWDKKNDIEYASRLYGARV